jgi:hypothetical protein
VAVTFHVEGFDDKKGTTGLRVYPQHVRLWHMKKKDSMLFLILLKTLKALCYEYCKVSLCNCWIIRCNKMTFVFFILHLKLCVLAFDLGTSTEKHRDCHL